MHSTDHKHDACQIQPWQRRNADRVCEHGDSRMLQEAKRQRRQRLRAEGKREARA